MSKFILFVLICFTSFSQKEKLTGKTLIDIGYKAFTENNYDQSIKIFEQAAKQFLIEKDTTEILHSYNLIFGVLETQSKSREFLKYESELNKFKNSTNFQTIVIYNCLGAAFRDNLNLEKAKQYFNAAIQKTYKYKVLTDEMYYHQGRTYNNISKLNKILGDRQAQITNIKLGINSYLKIKEKYPQDSSEIGNQYLELAEQLKLENKQTEAFKTLKIAKTYFQKNDFTLFINHYQQMAMLLINNDIYKIDEVKDNLNKAILMQTKSKITNQIGRSYEILGDGYFKIKEYFNSEKAYQKSLEIRLETKNPLAITKGYKNIAKTHNAQQNYPTALQNLQKAFQYNSTNFTSENIAENPKIEQIKYKNDALEIFKEKIIGLLAIYKKEGKKEYLDYALATAERVHELINYQRNSFQLEGSKLFLSQQAHAIYGSAIEASYEKYRNKNEPKYLELAFKYSESNKAVVLFESIKATEKNGFEGVPLPLIDQEYTAIKNLAVFESQMYSDIKNQDLWRKKLLEVTDELAKIKAIFKNKYPKYYEYKYNNEPILLAEIKSKLAANQSVIEYFLFDNSLFTFLISKDSSVFTKQNLPTDFWTQIINFRSKIVDKSIDMGYQNISNQIYQTLFPLQLQKVLINKKISNLKIVADAELNYIPFESLITRIPKSLKEPDIYLLEKYSIGYLPSATMNWKNVLDTKTTWFPNKYIGFGPKYPSQFDLPYNRENVRKLASDFSGESFLFDEANKQNFDKISTEKSNILHLSMHGGASATDPMESYLAFEIDSLFSHDIYAKTILSELTILDACETGVGILNNGEGVLNIARAFLHAGSKAVAMSLWKLNSSIETAEIIKDFSTLVADGEAKDRALQQAKLNYLAKHRSELLLSHPYFWSPLIMVGNADPIPESYLKYWLALFILFIAYAVSSKRKG